MLPFVWAYSVELTFEKKVDCWLRVLGVATLTSSIVKYVPLLRCDEFSVRACLS
jgi:hypothetical protein